MIDPWIIEDLKRREEEQRRLREEQRPRLEIPLPPRLPPDEKRQDPEERVVTIQIM